LLREELARPASLGDRAEADERPQLPQPHPEVGIAVDEHDVVVVAEQPLQLEGGRDTAEAAAEDQGPRRHVGWAARSSSS
jgi:hypothetical protein